MCFFFWVSSKTHDAKRWYSRGYGLGVSLWGSDGCGKREATPMVAGLDAIKKGKNRGKKGEKGRGAMQKKVTFGGDRVRKSGGITPTVRVSSISLYPHSETI